MTTSSPVPGQISNSLVPVLGSSDYYLYKDPRKVSIDEYMSLWGKHWRSFFSFPSDIDVAKFVRYLTLDGLFLDIAGEPTFIRYDKIETGDVAIYKALDVAIGWVRGLMLANMPSNSEETEKLPVASGFLKHAHEMLSGFKGRANLGSMLKVIMAGEVEDENKGNKIEKWELPCIIWAKGGHKRKILGKLSLKTGKIQRITNISRFPVLSGLEFPESYFLTPEVDWKNSKFRAYLSSLVGGDEEKINFMLRLLAVYCEEGNDRHIWTWLQGPAGNGKSVFVDLLVQILGDLATKGDNEAYNGESQGQRFARASMENRRLAYFSELSRGFRLHDGKLKGDTEGKVRIEKKYRDSHEITNTCKPFFVSNFSVHISDDTEATRGRLILVDSEGKNWRKSENRILNYHKILWHHERDLILSKLIEAYQYILAHGLAIPLDFQGDSAANRAKTTFVKDTYKEYIAVRVVKSENPKTRLYSADVLEDFRSWCIFNGLGMPDKREIDGLGKAMSAMFGKAEKSSRSYRLGLELGEKYEDKNEEIDTFSNMREIPMLAGKSKGDL